MRGQTNEDKIESIKQSNKQFEILLKICLIIGIIVVSGFILFYALTPEPGYITFGILNENQEAENYPTEATINESISFYLTVGNYMNRNSSLQIQVKKGDKYTLMLPDVPTNGSLNFIIGNFTLSNGEDWISEKLNISFSQIGNNQLIITEVWQIKNSIPEFYTKLWVRLNITN